MSTPLIALIAFAVGVVVGAGVTGLLVWAVRLRSRGLAQASREVPAGITDVLDSMDDAACVVDSSGVVQAASEAAQKLGIEVGTVLENRGLRDLLRTVRTGGEADSVTLTVVRERTGLDPRRIAARASRISPRLQLLVMRDVTDQERVQQMRNDFVTNTSHELKTPVASMSLLSEAIVQAADEPEQVRLFAERMSAEADRLVQLIGRIMSLSRLQSAEGFTEREPVAIDRVIAQAIDAHQVQAHSAHVEIVCGGDEGAWVRGDAQILTEAVANLVTNAIAYSPQGSRVGVGVRADDDVVEIAVTDQGPGITEAERDRVFERFYRADEARSRRTGGTGLGLSIVKHAAQQHGGEATLWSRPGRGSTFTIRLPRISAPSTLEKEH